MGLLTDPSGLRGRPFQVLVNHHSIICIILYLSSLIWFGMLASDQVNSGTYLSENALLPGLVMLNSDVITDTKIYLQELEIKMRENGHVIPAEWLQSKFSSMGINSYVQNFTLNYPFSPGKKFYGINVYGIIRGGGSGNEAMVLSVPFRSSESPHPTTAPGLALLLAITSYFRKQKYWAKDLIMLATEYELLGMQAWLEAYHGTSCGNKGVLEAGELPARGGAIQAAINLELSSLKMKKIDVKLLGLNGQLPNLDLVNLVHRICSKERVRHSYANKEKISNLPASEQWQHSVHTMLATVLGQATGLPDGNHGLFHRFGIEAITMAGVSKEGSGQHITMHNVGRVVEGIFRSINNLLERFHQSYFFYILTDTDRFVSIGLYTPCVGMMVGALLIRAFAVHVTLRDDSIKELETDMSRVCSVILTFQVMSVLVYYTPIIFSNYLLPTLEAQDAIFYGFLAMTVVSVLLPKFIIKRSKLNEKDWTWLNVIVLLSQSSITLALSMNNLSQAYLSSVLLIPLSLLTSVHGNMIKSKLWLILHPTVLIICIVIYNTWLYHNGLPDTYTKLLQPLKSVLLLNSLDSYIYSCWTYGLIVLCYLPIWSVHYILSLN
uniref:Putative conserved plasma membrane protein n=1 Tax=Panstrongylus lignarius TaxID=156445 RepID=A0A224XLV1_9HEMI